MAPHRVLIVLPCTRCSHLFKILTFGQVVERKRWGELLHLHLHSRALSVFLASSPQPLSECLTGCHFPSMEAALCTVYEVVIAMNNIRSFMRYWSCLGGKGNWVNLRYWHCYYFFFLMAKGRDE